MRPFFKTIFFATLSTLFSLVQSSAIDFDQDGYDDFVLININANNRLVWYAIDINDSARRALGPFGRAGDHLAVGDWFGASQSAKARILKKASGELAWDIQISGTDTTLVFGRSGDMVISGFDGDMNGAIDAVVVSELKKSLNWKIVRNPALNPAALPQEIIFGTKKDLPFYANFDGSGDSIATAKVNNRGLLQIRYKSIVSGKSRSINVKNFRSKIHSIIPVALPSGKDSLYVVTKTGKKFNVTILIGKRKVRSLKVNGDEFVVGKYLGDGREIFLVRNNSTTGTFITSKGKKHVINIDLDGILADEVNINSFKERKTPKPPKNPPSASPTPPPGGGDHGEGGGNGDNPACSGTSISTEHLLYKPVSDTTGNAVLVFDSKYGREFLAVRIELKDGTFAEAWWKGLELWGNPDPGGPRQHWRTNVRASQVKDNALIIAEDTNQQCRFVLPGSANRRWE